MENTAISALLLKILLVPMVGLWAFHLYQRKFRDAGARKRIATLSLTMVIIGAWAAAWLFSHYGVSDRWLVVVAIAAAAVLIWQKHLMLPFNRLCAQCGKPVPILRMFTLDSNTCEACERPATEGEIRR